MSSEDETWAQLVSTTENDSDPIEIKKNKFIIGRSKVADLCLMGNKLVSGSHCYIERDGTGEAWLQDTSTNGTLLNLTQKVIGTRRKLGHGDEIHVVYRKSDPALNVAYLFQDMETLRREELEESSENTQAYSVTDELDTTGTVENSDPVENKESSSKRKSQDTSFSDIPASKKQKSDEPTVAAYSSKLLSDGGNKSSAVDKKTVDMKAGETSKSPDDKSTGLDKTDSASGDQKTSNVVGEMDAFEESLICIICQEILHDCVSCQPCMHSFCGGCYSDWMTRSQECPSCRGKVERVNKNYIINNLVDAYLKNHPDKCRPEEELKALDARSKIMKDTMKIPKLKKTISELIDEDEDMDDDDDDGDGLSDSDGSEDHQDTADGGIAPAPFAVAHPFGGGLFGAMSNLIPIKPVKTICRQCPEYIPPVVTAVTGAIGTATSVIGNVVSKAVDLVKGKAAGTSGGGTSTTATKSETGVGPSTSEGGSGSNVTTPVYECRPTQVHILCQCCLQPMPDRRTEAVTDKSVPSQQCIFCYRLYCHNYWGCRNLNCSGCMGKFKDLKFSNKSLSTIILDNNYESDIFKNVIESQGKSLADVVKECLTKMDAGEYSCMDQARGLTSNTVVCYTCGLRNLRDLAYMYRKNIPAGDLPAAVKARPDCYWGKNCRTQRGKMHHAAKFNHICDQTR